MISIVPPSGASTATPRTETRRGLFGSNTVPSTQRSPESVCSLIDTRLVKCRDRELRVSTISMPRARAAARALTIETPLARVDDQNAARQDGPQQAGCGRGRQHLDAAALDQRAVVADAQRLDPRRAHLR